jgi:hypothetical protein
MHHHLFGEMGAKDFGEFVFTAVLILSESTHDIICLSGEPLVVPLEVAIHEEVCVVSSLIDVCFGLDVVVSLFEKFAFPIHPLAVVLSIMESAQSPL